jgi:hypothetical protein
LVTVDELLADVQRVTDDKPKDEASKISFLELEDEPGVEWGMLVANFGDLRESHRPLSVVPPFDTRPQDALTEAWLEIRRPNRRAASDARELASKLVARFSMEEISELNRAFGEALEISQATADQEVPSALEGFEQQQLSDDERIEATLGALLRRFVFRRRQIAQSVPAEEVAQWIGVSVGDVERIRANADLVAIEDLDDRWVYPKWQFDETTADRRLTGLRQILNLLRDLGPLQTAAWLVQPKPALSGRSPVDALRENEFETVEFLARRVSGIRG